jgi:hypothetical protein
MNGGGGGGRPMPAMPGGMKSLQEIEAMAMAQAGQPMGQDSAGGGFPGMGGMMAMGIPGMGGQWDQMSGLGMPQEMGQQWLMGQQVIDRTR